MSTIASGRPTKKVVPPSAASAMPVPIMVLSVVSRTIAPPLSRSSEPAPPMTSAAPSPATTADAAVMIHQVGVDS